MWVKRKNALAGMVIASALLTASTVLYADDATVQRPARSTTVQFGDLSLATPNDVAALYHRINLAAKRVCGSRAFTGIYYTLPEYRSCVADAVRNAVASVNRPSLTEFYRQQQSTAPSPIRVAEQ